MERKTFLYLLGSVVLGIGARHLMEQTVRPSDEVFVYPDGESNFITYDGQKTLPWRLINSTDLTMAFKPSAIEARFSFIQYLSEKYYSRANKNFSKVDLFLHTHMDEGAAHVEVADSTANIRLASKGFDLTYGETETQTAGEAMDAILTDELTNLLSDETQTNFKGTLENTDLTGLNQREINEVFSHGVRLATASLLANDQHELTNPFLAERVYNEIYIPFLSMFKMNPAYFTDKRKTQQGYQMSLEDFKRYAVIIKQTGPAIRVVR